MCEPAIRRQYAKTLGELAVSYLEEVGGPTAASLVQSRAVSAIFEIQGILRGRDLDEAEACRRVQAVVDAFFARAPSPPATAGE